MSNQVTTNDKLLSAEVDEMKRRILRFLYETGYYVSFTELDTGVEGFSGGYEFTGSGKFKNIVFWKSMSEEAVLAIIQLKDKGLIDFSPSSFRTYLINGVTLQLPLAERPGEYKVPHWFPLTINITKKGEAKVTKLWSQSELQASIQRRFVEDGLCKTQQPIAETSKKGSRIL